MQGHLIFLLTLPFALNKLLLALSCTQGLEEASRLYFGESNVEGMLATLLPLHDMVKHSGASTLKEIAFVQSYGRCVFVSLCFRGAHKRCALKKITFVQS